MFGTGDQRTWAEQKELEEKAERKEARTVSKDIKRSNPTDKFHLTKGQSNGNTNKQ